MSQIPVLKSAAHTHTRRADKAVSTEPLHSSSCCSKCCRVEGWARPAEAFQGCRGLNLCYPHSLTRSSRGGSVRPVLCKALLQGFPPAPARSSHTGVFEHPSPRPRAGCHTQRFLLGEAASAPSFRGAAPRRRSFALSFACLAARGGLCSVLFVRV